MDVFSFFVLQSLVSINLHANDWWFQLMRLVIKPIPTHSKLQYLCIARFSQFIKMIFYRIEIFQLAIYLMFKTSKSNINLNNIECFFFVISPFVIFMKHSFVLRLFYFGFTMSRYLKTINNCHNQNWILNENAQRTKKQNIAARRKILTFSKIRFCR